MKNKKTRMSYQEFQEDIRNVRGEKKRNRSNDRRNKQVRNEFFSTQWVVEEI